MQSFKINVSTKQQQNGASFISDIKLLVVCEVERYKYI